MAYAPMVSAKKPEFDSLVAQRRALAGLIETSGTDAEKQKARSEIELAVKAIAFYRQQVTAKELAPVRSYTVAYDFGVELTKRARRQPQSISQIQSAIAEQFRLQRENANFDEKEDPTPAGAGVVAVNQVVDSTRTLASSLNGLAEGLLNLALLLNGMTLYKTNALAGAPLPTPDIKYFGIGSDS